MSKETTVILRGVDLEFIESCKKASGHFVNTKAILDCAQKGLDADLDRYVYEDRIAQLEEQNLKMFSIIQSLGMNFKAAASVLDQPDLYISQPDALAQGVVDA